MALVVSGKLAHEGFDGVAAFGWIAPYVDVSASRCSVEPEREGAATEDHQLTATQEPGGVGYDARDICRIDHDRRPGKGWLERML